MSDRSLEDYLVLRSLDEPITESELDAAVENSGEALQSLREEDVSIRWIDSEVMTNGNGKITGTFCHYQAEDEETIREHAERAGLPATRIDHRGEPLQGE